LKKNYELIEHTADIGIRVSGKDLKKLFRNAAAAMFDIIAQGITTGEKKENLKVEVKAGNIEELLVSWLNELLSLSATRKLIFSDFRVNKLTDNTLEAGVFGERVENYMLNVEIKAATYHEVKIVKAAKGWKAEVIFDV
jgi:SHS2 domain-containing protein